MNLLQGITLLDFTRLLPGPLATNLLAQAGAHVIKIEHPQRQDYARKQPPLHKGDSLFFQALNHSKSFQTLDYQSPEGAAILTEMIKNAHVLIEQFRPGAMESWGWGYEAVRKINPQIVYISLTGYGQTGPSAHLAGHDLNYLACSGVLSLNKDERGKPVIPGIQMADIGSGAYMTVSACMMGLYHQMRTGQSIYIDVSMLDGLMPLLAFPLTQHWGGWDPQTLKVLSGGLVNYNVYECADGKWVALGALELKFWRNFCAWANRPDWIRNHEMELATHIFPGEEVADLFKTRTQAAWIQAAENHEICLSPIVEIDELEAQEQLLARKVFSQFQTDRGNTLPGLSFPFKNFCLGLKD